MSGEVVDCDCLLTPELDLGKQAPHPSSVLVMYPLPTIPTVGAGFKGASMKE